MKIRVTYVVLDESDRDFLVWPSESADKLHSAEIATVFDFSRIKLVVGKLCDGRMHTVDVSDFVSVSDATRVRYHPSLLFSCNNWDFILDFYYLK